MGDIKNILERSSFWESKIILAGNNLGIFEFIGTDSHTALEISKGLALASRASEILLNSMVAIGLLNKQDGKYSNTDISKKALLKTSDEYVGNVLMHMENMWEAWGNLDEIVKSGAAFPRDPHGDEETHDFINAMDELSKLTADKVVDHMSLKGNENVLDVGGGPGTYLTYACNQYSNVRGTIFDLPIPLKVAQSLIKEYHFEDRIELRPGDYHVDDFGNTYDVVLLSNIIHSLDPNDIVFIMKKCGKALNDGGYLYVKEFYVNEDRVSPQQPAVFAVNMLVNTPKGMTYTEAETKKYAEEAGFKYVETMDCDSTSKMMKFEK